MKIGLFVQDKTPAKCNEKELNRKIKKVAENKLDLLVFPEDSYTNFSKMANNFDMLDFDSSYIITGFCDDLSEKAGCPIIFSGSDMFGTKFNIFSNGNEGEKETGFKLYIKHFGEEFSPFQLEDYAEWAESFFEPFSLKDKHICMMNGKEAEYPVLSSVCKNNDVDIFINVLEMDADYNEVFRLNRVRAVETKSFVFCVTPAVGEKSGAFTLGFTPDGDLMEGIPLYTDGSVAGNIFVYDTESYNSEKVSICEEDDVLAENPDFVIDCEAAEELLKSSEKINDYVYLKEMNGNNLVIVLLKGEEIMDAVKCIDIFYDPALKEIERKRYLLINKWEKEFDEYDGVIDDVFAVRTIENKCASVLCAPDYKKCSQINKNGKYIILNGEEGRFGITLDVAGGPEFIWNEEMGGCPESWREHYESLIKFIHGEKLSSEGAPLRQEVNFDLL